MFPRRPNPANLPNAPANHPFTAMLGAAGVGAGVVAGGVALNKAAHDMQQGALPGYRQDMTAQERADYDASLSQGTAPMDYLQYQGTRQALMSDMMSSSDVDRFAAEGFYTDRAQEMIGDIHNFGSSGLSPDPMKIAQSIAESEGPEVAEQYLQTQREEYMSAGIEPNF